MKLLRLLLDLFFAFVSQDEVGTAVLEAEQERSRAQHLTAAQHEAQVKVFRFPKSNYKCTWFSSSWL